MGYRPPDAATIMLMGINATEALTFEVDQSNEADKYAFGLYNFLNQILTKDWYFYLVRVLKSNQLIIFIIW